MTVRTWGLLLCVSCALLVTGCDFGIDMNGINAMIANAQAVQRAQGTVNGQIVAGTAAEPVWTFEPGACKSGQNDGFYGVDLASQNHESAVLRLVQDPIEGPRVRIQRLTGHGPVTLQLDRSRCSVLELKVEREGVSFNHVTALDGALVLDCHVDGQNVAGTIRFQGCHRSELVDQVTASMTDGSAEGPTAHVPETAPVPSLPQELTGLRVRLEPHVVGVLVQGDTMEHAQAACLEGDAKLAHQLGWKVVDDGSPPDLVARFGCTGHVVFTTKGRSVQITVPRDGTPSLVLSVGDRVVATVPAGAARWACESDAQSPEQDCARRVSAAAGARIANLLAGSPELRAFVQERRAQR